MSLFVLCFIKPPFPLNFACVFLLKFLCLSSLMKCFLNCEILEELKDPCESTFQVSKRKIQVFGGYDTLQNINTVLSPNYRQ